MDGSAPAPLLRPDAQPPPPRRWVSPLLRRILLVNVLPPALLAASHLYLDQYQDGLLAAEVEAMRTRFPTKPLTIGELAALAE